MRGASRTRARRSRPDLGAPTRRASAIHRYTYRLCRGGFGVVAWVLTPPAVRVRVRQVVSTTSRGMVACWSAGYGPCDNRRVGRVIAYRRTRSPALVACRVRSGATCRGVGGRCPGHGGRGQAHLLRVGPLLDVVNPPELLVSPPGGGPGFDPTRLRRPDTGAGRPPDQSLRRHPTGAAGRDFIGPSRRGVRGAVCAPISATAVRTSGDRNGVGTPAGSRPGRRGDGQ